MAISMISHKSTGSKSYLDLTTALFDLSHSGQESFSTALSDGRNLYFTDGSGIVDILNMKDPGNGHVGVAQNDTKPGTRVSRAYCPQMREFALAFDGYLCNGQKLRERFGGNTDGDVAARLIADANDFEKGITVLDGEAKGHFCIAVADERGEAFAARSPSAVHTLIYGEGEKGQAVVSESRALSDINMRAVRDLYPGEIAAFDGSNLHTLKRLEGRAQICSFLWAYYHWIDSVTQGIAVEAVRSGIGGLLAEIDRNLGLKADRACPIPDSGKGYSEGYSRAAGIMHSEPLIKFPYAGRSYDRPEQYIRDLVARLKLKLIPSRASGLVLVVTDDSIRRGTQLVEEFGPLKLLQTANPKAIHLRIGSPRNIKFCRYAAPEKGSYRDDTLAANRFRTDEDMARFVGVDSIRFIDLDPFVEAITSRGNVKRHDICLGCYTGEFPLLS